MSVCLLAQLALPQEASTQKPWEEFNPPGVEISGRALDSSWSPIHEARVQILLQGWASSAEAKSQSVQTDELGRYRMLLGSAWIEKHSGDYHIPILVVSAAGKETASVVMDRLRSRFGSLRSSLQMTDLVLPLGRTLRGVVRDQQGQPIAGAGGSAASLLASTIAHGGVPRSGGIATSCNADGSFSLQGASLGPLRLRASAPGFTESYQTFIDGRDELHFVLRKAPLVIGKLIDADGEPVHGQVLVDHANGAQDAGETGPDGGFTIPLSVVGPFRLTGWQGRRVTRKVVTNPAEEVVLRLPEPETRKKFIVRVRDSDGEPASLVRARVDWGSTLPIPVYRPGLLKFLTSAGSDKGEVELIGPAKDGEVTGYMYVGATGMAWKREEVSWSADAGQVQTVEVKLEPQRILSGKVLWEGTEEPSWMQGFGSAWSWDPRASLWTWGSRTASKTRLQAMGASPSLDSRERNTSSMRTALAARSPNSSPSTSSRKGRPM